MIQSFASRDTERIWHGYRVKSLPTDIQPVARRKLRMLNNAAGLRDLRIPPANCLEKLRGTRAGQYSNRINDQWRICFAWINGHAAHVEIIDYHRG